MHSSWKMGTRACGALAIGVLAAAAAACGGEQYPQTTFRPVSEFGEGINRVFANTFWWTMGILLIVLVLIVYVVVRFRAQPGQPLPKQIHGNTKLELLWTVIPAIIVIFIAVPTVQTIFATQRRAAEDALVVEVIGHQWWWEFRYPELGVVTANQVWVPVGREIHLRMHSADVVHSFWVPRIGGKRDVNPQPRTATGERPRFNSLIFTVAEPGTYSGQCAEFCGEAHAIMQISLVAVNETEFDAWAGTMREAPALPPATPDITGPEPEGGTVMAPGQPAPLPQDTMVPPPPTDVGPQDPLVEQGRVAFLSSACIACHAVANTSARGVLGPNLTRFGARPTIGAGALPNTQENLERWIRDPRSVKQGALMPGSQRGAPPPGNPAGQEFPATGLTDEQVRAIAAYLLSLQ